MLIINKNLIPLKGLLFFLFGAYGCLWPFLSVHMKKLGLTVEETAIINFVTPFVSILGPPLACLLANKTHKSKQVLIISLAVSAVAFSALLFVPPTHRHPPRDPKMIFECGVDGGRVSVERCGEECEIPLQSPAPSSLGLRSCNYVCDEGLGAKGPGDSTPDKPYICVDRNNGTFCNVYNASGDAFDIVLNVPFIRFVEEVDKCVYPTIHQLKNGSVVNIVQCRIQNPGCAVRCRGFREENDPTALSPYQCKQVDGNPLLTFGAYAILRTVAEFFMYSSFALLDATVLNSIWDFGGLYSQQFLWGLLSIGFLAPVVGLLIDLIYSDHQYMTYAPAFIAFDLLVLFTVIFVAVMPSRVHSCVNRLGTYAEQIVKNAEVVTFFAMIFCLGIPFGFLETFYYWFLDDRNADSFFLGLTMMVGIFPSIPLLFFGDPIVKNCSHANILIAAFFANVFRCVAYSFFDDIWTILPFDVLKVFGNYLMWVAAMTYCEKLGPKVLASTITGTVAILHSNAGMFPYATMAVILHLTYVGGDFFTGRGIGALIGGYIMSNFGAVNAFRVTAIFSGTVGVIYLALYHFYLKFRRSPIYIESNLNGHYTPMEICNNGENHLQKPMLADRDRY